MWTRATDHFVVEILLGLVVWPPLSASLLDHQLTDFFLLPLLLSPLHSPVDDEAE